MNVNGLAMPDPLADLPPPNPATMPLQSKKKLHFTSGTTVLQPGVYEGGISATSSANLVLMPGIYYMDEGGFQFTGGGSIVGDGVMIYNDAGKGESRDVNLSSSGTVRLSAPTSGIYQGIVFYQDRTSDVAAVDLWRG